MRDYGLSEKSCIFSCINCSVHGDSIFRGMAKATSVYNIGVLSLCMARTLACILKESVPVIFLQDV